jgi:hypothetical protein
MWSGNWSIVIEAYDIDFSVQRDFELVVGILPKVTTTAIDTMIVGITTVPDPLSMSHLFLPKIKKDEIVNLH